MSRKGNIVFRILILILPDILGIEDLNYDVIESRVIQL